MDYVKGILCGFAAVLIAEFAFLWSVLGGAKAIGRAAFVWMLVESILSPKFWIIAVLSFGVFFAASRASTILRVLFFWIPTVAVSALGCAMIGLYTYLALSPPPK
jgi:hypothetical protein